MRLHDDYSEKRVNTTEIYRRYTEVEIERLLSEDLAKRAAVKSAEKISRVTFGSREKAGMAGPEMYAEVNLVVDHDPKPRDAKD